MAIYGLNNAYTRSCIATLKSADQSYGDLMVGLGQEGYDIIAFDRTAGIIECHATRLQSCSCRHFIQVARERNVTLVLYSIEPRYLFFTLCRHRNVRSKVQLFANIVRRSTMTVSRGL